MTLGSRAHPFNPKHNSTEAGPGGLVREGPRDRHDLSQADPAEFPTWRQDDTSAVRIGDEASFLPDAIINGG